MESNIFIETKGLKGIKLDVPGWLHKHGKKLAEKINGTEYLQIAHEGEDAGLFKCEDVLTYDILRCQLASDIHIAGAYE